MKTQQASGRARWQELVAAVGVILSLLFVGFEIRQNTAVARGPDPSRISAEVEAAVQAFHAADTSMNAEAVIGLLWPDYTMFVDGTRIGYDDVVAGSRDFMASLELFHTDWTDLEITVLGPDAAVASFLFRDSIVTSAGDLIQARGPTSFVWQRRGGEWRLLFGDADHYPIDP